MVVITNSFLSVMGQICCLFRMNSFTPTEGGAAFLADSIPRRQRSSPTAFLADYMSWISFSGS